MVYAEKGEGEMDNIMTYKGYWAKIKYSDEDECFCGSIDGLEHASISFEGDNVEELKKDFQDAIDSYLETCKGTNSIPEKQYKGSFNVRIEPELHRKATLFAESFNISLNQFVAKAIRDEIEACESKRVK